MAKRTTITIETDALLFVASGKTGKAWCERCGTRVEVCSPRELQSCPSVNGIVLESPIGSAESAALHWLVGPGGARLLCLSSLLAWIQTLTCGFPPARPKEDK